ncbi:unnamed protein product [marine sediment metagenome]|uniref:Uncharacterized protein n=1 Tax=marine sediment metagenome TaxID=412755 RepID=X1H339_9ZZZZ
MVFIGVVWGCDMKKLFLILPLIILLFASQAFGTDWFVCRDGQGTGGADGTAEGDC